MLRHIGNLSQLELFEQVLLKYFTDEEWEEIKSFFLTFKINTPTLSDLRAMSDKHFVIEQVREMKGVGYWGMAMQYVFRKKPHL